MKDRNFKLKINLKISKIEKLRLISLNNQQFNKYVYIK